MDLEAVNLTLGTNVDELTAEDAAIRSLQDRHAKLFFQLCSCSNMFCSCANIPDLNLSACVCVGP